MPRHQVERSRLVRAPAPRIYAIVADYRDGHRRILPPTYFKWLIVEEGGTGAGTRIRFAMRVFGSTQVIRSVVDEPEPGRVLVETDVERGTRSTFLLDRSADDATRVTIRTDIEVHGGIAGSVERFLITKYLTRVYDEELRRLAEYAEGTHVHAPVPQEET